MKDKMTEIAGLWERTSAGGNEYLGGKTSEEITIPKGAFVMVFENKSDNPKAPTFRVLYAMPRD